MREPTVLCEWCAIVAVFYFVVAMACFAAGLVTMDWGWFVGFGVCGLLALFVEWASS